MKENWCIHYDKLTEKKLPPSNTLIKALEFFKDETDYAKHAIDLGCGTGIDTLALLEKGWKVMAIDKQPSAITYLKNKIPGISQHKIELIQGEFEWVDLPKTTLVNASFSIPFCQPEHFESAWKRIENAIAPGGRFAGQFFGWKDTWAVNDSMSFHTETQVKELFKAFVMEYVDEVETTGQTIGGLSKHWHIFHVVARKKIINTEPSLSERLPV